jgi:hypothetical protein
LNRYLERGFAEEANDEEIVAALLASPLARMKRLLATAQPAGKRNGFRFFSREVIT